MKIIFKGEFTDLNIFQDETRRNKFAGARIKKAETNRAFWECRSEPREKINEYPVTIHFDWYCKNNRKDPDNICFARKFLLDGMVLAGVLKDDSREFIAGFSDMFYTDKENVRIEILIKKL